MLGALRKGCCAGGWSSEQRWWPLCSFGMQHGTPPLPFPEILLATEVVFRMVLSCLYLLVQDWTSHLFIDSKFVFPFSCASPGTGKHVSGSCCYWQPAERECNCAKEKHSVTTPTPQTLDMGLHGNVTPSHDLLCDVVLGFHQALKASEPMAVSV